MGLPDSPDVIVESDEIVWNGRFPLHVIKFRQRRFDGAFSGVRSWEMLRRGKAAAVLPYDPVADRVVVIEQFRLPGVCCRARPGDGGAGGGAGGWGRDAGGPPFCASRARKCGLEVESLEKIGDFLLTPGGCDELCTLFAGRVRLGAIGADGLLGSGGLASEQEDILVRALPAEEVIERALAGAYANSVASLGLLWFAAKREYLRAKWLG